MLKKKYFYVLLFLLAGNAASGQSAFKIAGKVSDEKGQAMRGVNIVIKHTQTGTATGGNGTYVGLEKLYQF